MDDSQYESDYCMELGDHSALEPAPPFRYVNHSCHPNCGLIELEREEDADRPRLWLKVEADIAPDEELTIDYAWPVELQPLARAAVPIAGTGSWRQTNWIESYPVPRTICRRSDRFRASRGPSRQRRGRHATSRSLPRLRRAEALDDVAGMPNDRHSAGVCHVSRRSSHNGTNESEGRESLVIQRQFGTFS